MQMTEYEFKVMNAIAHSEYTPINGATPEDSGDCSTWLWPSDIAKEVSLTVNQVKGVLSSLVKKEWIVIGYACKELGDTDDSVDFTEEGFVCWQHVFVNKGMEVK